MRVEGTQHCSSKHVINGAHCINGKDGGSRVDFDRRTKDTSKSLRACSCAEPVLVGEASLLKLRGKSLGKCASNEPSENIPDHQRTDSPAIWLLQSHHPANTQCRKSRPWHVCLRKPLSSAVQELAVKLVVKKCAQVLIGDLGGPGSSTTGRPQAGQESLQRAGLGRPERGEIRRQRLIRESRATRRVPQSFKRVSTRRQWRGDERPACG